MQLIITRCFSLARSFVNGFANGIFFLFILFQPPRSHGPISRSKPWSLAQLKLG